MPLIPKYHPQYAVSHISAVPPPNLHSPDDEGGGMNVDPVTPYLGMATSGMGASRPPSAGPSLVPPPTRKFSGGIKNMWRSSHDHDMRLDNRFTRDSEALSGSESSTSETVRNPSSEADAETTAVGHEYYNYAAPAGYASPEAVLAEPRPASDYAKMSQGSQSTGIHSISAYFARMQKFFHDLNDLPWVADRVTVDYIPRQTKRHSSLNSRDRQVPSWYNYDYSPPMVVDMLSSPSNPASVQSRAASTDAPPLMRSLDNPQYASIPMKPNPPPPARTPSIPPVPRYMSGYVPGADPAINYAVYSPPNQTSAMPMMYAGSSASTATTAAPYPYPVFQGQGRR